MTGIVLQSAEVKYMNWFKYTNKQDLRPSEGETALLIVTIDEQIVVMQLSI